MNKRAARERALEGALSVGELRQMIKRRRGAGGMSKVNPAIDLDRALGIYADALGDRPDDEVPRVWKPDPYSRAGRMKPTADALLITNILRDAE